MKSLEHPIKLDEPQVSVVENATQRALRAALRRLDGGRNWVKVDPHEERGTYCTITAAQCHYESNILLKAALGARTMDAVFAWNDAPERTFADVEALYLKAIELAGTSAPQGAA